MAEHSAIFDLEPKEFKLYCMLLALAGTNGKINNMPNFKELSKICKLGINNIKDYFNRLCEKNYINLYEYPDGTTNYKYVEIVGGTENFNIFNKLKEIREEKHKKNI